MSSLYNEKQQIKALSEGDVKAFDLLFIHYYPKLKQFILGFIHNELEAEDLSQDVFVKIWNRREGLQNVENLNAYIYRTAKNTLFSYLERNTRIDAVELENEEIPTTDTLEELLFAKELEELIDKSISLMPPKRKMIFSLSRKSGLSNEEIATKLNISKRTVETHISAALIDLRKVIQFLTLII
jgi:RNA polymerase sigma-70 factor (ECF subfamily)